MKTYVFRRVFRHIFIAEKYLKKKKLQRRIKHTFYAQSTFPRVLHFMRTLNKAMLIIHFRTLLLRDQPWNPEHNRDIENKSLLNSDWIQ
jgi:hypothetical protein